MPTHLKADTAVQAAAAGLDEMVKAAVAEAVAKALAEIPVAASPPPIPDDEEESVAGNDPPTWFSDDYATPEEIARALGVTLKTLHRWHVERTGPPRIKVGKSVFYSRAAFREWLEQNREDRPARRSKKVA